MGDTANGAKLLATARELRPRILSQREAIEASRRLPAIRASWPGPGSSAFSCRRRGGLT
jgi:hypothetical protein